MVYLEKQRDVWLLFFPLKISSAKRDQNFWVEQALFACHTFLVQMSPDRETNMYLV